MRPLLSIDLEVKHQFFRFRGKQIRPSTVERHWHGIGDELLKRGLIQKRPLRPNIRAFQLKRKEYIRLMKETSRTEVGATEIPEEYGREKQSHMSDASVFGDEKNEKFTILISSSGASFWVKMTHEIMHIYELVLDIHPYGSLEKLLATYTAKT